MTDARLISTHAPRTGSDNTPTPPAGDEFQPTLPARGATSRPSSRCPSSSAFQPTLPARGATVAVCRLILHRQISTHAPRTGSDEIILGNERNNTIFQPTLPARGATPPHPLLPQPQKTFQPTLPARGATSHHTRMLTIIGISTHAPRTGSDDFSVADFSLVDEISTHAPRTGSDALGYARSGRGDAISTHAPRTGSD